METLIGTADKSRQFIKEILNLNKSADYQRYYSPELEYPSSTDEFSRLKIVEGLMDLEAEEEGSGAKTWRLSKNLLSVSRLAGTHKALKTVYDGPAIPESSPEELEWAHLGLHINNGKGVRNRLRIVEEEIKHVASNFNLRNGNKFNVLSVAAGSGIGVIRSLASLGPDKIEKTNLLMVDNSKSAKRDGEVLASQLGLGRSAEFKLQDILATSEYLGTTFSLNLVEAVGIFDYLDDKTAHNLLAALHEHMTSGSTLLISNIIPNDEQKLLKKVILWPDMIYRKEDELLELVQKAGFKQDLMKLVQEPCGIYNIIFAKK